ASPSANAPTPTHPPTRTPTRRANIANCVGGVQNPFGEIDVTDLFYDDERSDPARWLTDRGWEVGGASLDDLAARYGRPPFEVPAEMGDMRDLSVYLTASK
ncbi:hypothetical protein ABH933_008844, partial [Nocardia sp. GP40]